MLSSYTLNCLGDQALALLHNICREAVWNSRANGLAKNSLLEQRPRELSKFKFLGVACDLKWGDFSYCSGEAV